MKLDVRQLRYLTSDDFRVLTAVEMGSKNHEIVPNSLIAHISHLRHGGSHKILQDLCRKKLVSSIKNQKYDGFRLTYGGYDYLAIKALLKQKILFGIGSQLGVGKESDIYLVVDEDNQQRVLKLQRLGRVSFRNIKSKRDYLCHRKAASWMYMSRLAAHKEFAFMKVLHDHGFPVPQPFGVNRHCIVMGLVDGFPLHQVKDVQNPEKLYTDLMGLIYRFAERGLIHGDFNEFNLMVGDQGDVVVIDFPQMVSTSHPNAEWYYDRDVNCIITFFQKRFGYESPTPTLKLSEIKQVDRLDIIVEASGFSRKDQQELAKLLQESEKLENDDTVESSEDDGSDHGSEEVVVVEEGEGEK